MEAFIVGIIVGAVLVYFYHKRKQPKPNNNDATGIPVNPRKEERQDALDLANQGQNRNPGDSPKGPRP
jgi:hypothetical protein